MNAAELVKIMEAIKTGRLNKCPGCLAWQIATDYLHKRDPIFEKALLELLEYENPEAQYPAYVTLCRCCDSLSNEAVVKINAYKEDPCHKRILREAQKKDCISSEYLPKK